MRTAFVEDNMNGAGLTILTNNNFLIMIGVTTCLTALTISMPYFIDSVNLSKIRFHHSSTYALNIGSRFSMKQVNIDVSGAFIYIDLKIAQSSISAPPQLGKCS